MRIRRNRLYWFFCLFIFSCGFGASVNLFAYEPKVKGDVVGSWTAQDMIYLATWNSEEVWERKHSTGTVGEVQYKFHDLSDDSWWGKNSAPGYYLPQVTQIYTADGNIYAYFPSDQTNNLYSFQYRRGASATYGVLKRWTMYLPGTFNNWDIYGSTMTDVNNDGNLWRITITTGAGNYELKFLMGQTWDYFHWGWEGAGSYQPLPHSGTAWRGPSFGSGQPQNIMITISEGFVPHLVEVDITNPASPSYVIKESSPPAAINNLSALSASSNGSVELKWTSPGDNGWSGTLPNSGEASFLIQYSTYNILWSTDSIKKIITVSAVAPLTEYNYTLSAVPGGATMYFRVWTRDESDNFSDISNGATIYIPTVTPDSPSALEQFAVSGSSDISLNWGSWTNTNTIKLKFTQSDTNTGEKLRYILDISTRSDFSFIYYSTTSLYLSQGATTFTLTSLPDGTSWYWRVRSQDEMGEQYLSGYSTAALGGVAFRIDTKPPSAISNLTALTGIYDGDVVLSWSAPSDDNASSEPLTDGVYQIKIATFNITSALYDSVVNNPPYSHVLNISTTSVAPGSSQSRLIRGILYPSTTWYFAIKTIDRGGNISSWSTVGVNTANSAPAQELPPQPPPAVIATSMDTTMIEVAWDPPPYDGYDDRDKYELYRATFVFTSTSAANVTLAATKFHPNCFHIDTVAAGNTYYYGVLAYDKGNGGDGLYSGVLVSPLSVIASTYPFTGTPPVVSKVYDDRSENNKNNYGVIDGIEDADGVVSFVWAKALGSIENYFVQVSSDPDFNFFSSSETLPGSVSSYTVSGLTKGVRHYLRVKAKRTTGLEGPWCVSDGIYVNRKFIDGDISEWGSQYASVADSVTVSAGDMLWRDKTGDQRGDRENSSQLDISSVGISADEYNLYLFVAFASTVSAGFDGRNYVQIMVDNDQTSTERVFRGRDNKYEDSYVSSVVPWEYLIEIVSGNDVVRVEDSFFSNRKYGKYSENNSQYFYEVALPLAYLGGKEKFSGKDVRFTIANFWNGGGADGSIGDWSTGTNSNIVDVITSTGTNTWNEVSDRSVEYYLSVKFSTAGLVSSATGFMSAYTGLPDEPEPAESGVSPAPPSALDMILYNLFIDAFYNGDPTNDDISDTNDYGGDFQGVIDKVGYLNEMGINVAYFGPPYKFGGGIWGFNIDDPFQYNQKFGGNSKYIEMMKTLRNHNIKVMNDWVCGQVGSKDSPAAVRNPDYYWAEQFGWGTKQEFAEPRAYYLNNMIWAFSTCDAFRYDNPKFWSYSFGTEAYEFNRALRKIADRWDPQLFIMGEIPEEVGEVNNFTGTNGPMLHGGEDMRSGGYKDNRNSHICSWVRPGSDAQSTVDARTGIENQQVTWKNQWSINPIMMENHDEKRFISRGRDLVQDAPWHQQVGYMTAFTIGVSPILFYGGEVGLEGPYDGSNSAKMDRDGNVREMPWERLSDGTWSAVRSAMIKTIQARANFPELRGDPKKGGRGFYTGGQYDGDVMVWARTGYGRKSIVMMNRSAGTVTLTNVGTGDASTLYKDWLTDQQFWTDASGNITSIGVEPHYGRILVRDGYDWANVTGTVTNASGQPIANAVIDIDGKSHWTTTTDANGYYSLSGELRKVLTGSRTIRAWAPGYNIVTRTVNITNNPVNNNVSFSAESGYPLTADQTPPAAPSTLSGRPRDKAAMIFWQASPEEDIQTYLIYRSLSPIPDGANPEPIFEVFKNFYYDSDFDNKLTNGVTYYYRIRAVDRNGNKSALSNQISIVPRAVKVKFWLDTRDYAGPGTRADSAAIAGGALTFSKNYFEQVALNSNGDGTFEREFDFDDTTFIEYKYVINGTLWEGNSSAGTLFYDGSQGEANRGELMDDAVPDFEVVDEGDGRMTVADVWRYYNDRPPRVPSGVQAAAGNATITVGWTKNAEPDMWYYEIQRSTWSTAFEGAVSTIMVDGDKNTYVDAADLILGNTYYYRVRAMDRKKNTSDWSSVSSAYARTDDVIAPAPPTGVKAIALGAYGFDGIGISWNPNYEGDLAGYNIYRSTQSGFAPSISNKLNTSILPPSATPYYEDKNIATGVTYYYRVVALDDSANVSDSSAELGCKIVPVIFNIDMGDINVLSGGARILGDTPPLDWSSGIPLQYVGASTYSVTLGFLSGANLQYIFSYNGVNVKEQRFNTSSGNREYTVTSSSYNQSVECDWEENPPVVSGVKVYGGAPNTAYIYWDADNVSEDLAGYNVYRSVPPSTTPTLKINSSPVSHSVQPFVVGDLAGETDYYFSVKAVDSGSVVKESTAAVAAGVFVSSPVYVSFGVPYQSGESGSPWGDSSRVKMYLAVKTSTDVSVWSAPADRADVTNGLMEMTATGSGEYRLTLPLGKGRYYNFAFFAKTTDNPPPGLSPNTEYYDTVPNSGDFLISVSSFSISPPGGGTTGGFAPVGATRDARRLIYLPASLAAGSTIYVFANFGSTPTAPTYIQAVGSDGKVTLYWSAPYGASWVRILDNIPIGGGESMKAADVVAGGKYRIYVATAPTDASNFGNYSLLAELPGSTFTYVHSGGVSNGTTYYYLMRAYDAFADGGISGNNYSVLSSTVSAVPSSSHIVVKIRVNRGAAPLWKSVRKSIAIQEGVSVSAWDAVGRSNVTPTGMAYNMAAPPDDPSEQEFSASLLPGVTYNFLLFAYSTFSISGLITNATYYDTVPSSGDGGMVASTSTVSVTGYGKVWCGPVGASYDARRLLCVPANLPSGSTWYVYCNFSSSPTAVWASASIVSSYSVRIEWAPYGAWGTNGEALKAADVIAGGRYFIWRSSVSSSGPWVLWGSTSSVNSWIDQSRFSAGDNLGLESGRTYYYVVVSSDAYSGDFVPNMNRAGAPSFSSSDAYATPRGMTPVYFKVEKNMPFPDDKYVLRIKFE